jgi:2,3-bisphosphoglycerate-dependent phosphoglycerate mutase
LSATGRAQARLLGERRRKDGIDQVICSDLQRAVETAQIAFAGTAIPILFDGRLRECNYGSLNGMPRSLLEAQRAGHLDEPWPHGESWREAVARVCGLLAELPARYPGQRVLLIGHVATRWALDHRACGVALEELAGAEFAWQEGWEYVLDDRGVDNPARPA